MEITYSKIYHSILRTIKTNFNEVKKIYKSVNVSKSRKDIHLPNNLNARLLLETDKQEREQEHNFVNMEKSSWCYSTSG